MSRDFRPRDALLALGIGYVAYKVCRFLWGFPLLSIILWGALALIFWLDGMNGWEAFKGFLAVPMLLGVLAVFALLADGAVFSGAFLAIFMAILIDLIQGYHECSIHTCYYEHQGWWNDIPTAHGWVHTLPPGVRPLPGWHYHPGLIARCWDWLSDHPKLIRAAVVALCVDAAIRGYRRFRRYRRWKRWHPE